MTLIGTSRRKYLRWLCLAIFAAVMFSPVRAFAQCYPANYGADPTDNVPDDWAIQQCLDQGGTTLLVSGGPTGYLITNTLRITLAGTTLTSASDPFRAHLVGTSDLNGSSGKGRILESPNLNNVVLSLLWFDGNKSNRSTSSCSPKPGGIFEYGKNLLITGTGWKILNVLSENAVCGSAAEVEGSGFEVANSTFKNNGYDSDLDWADGLTVWSCFGNGSIHDNGFYNNTDVNLIVGGGANCSVMNNTISNTFAHGFAGLMLDIFPQGGGNHSGFTYSGNTISSATNMLSFGLLVGGHPWTSAQNLISAGSVYGNTRVGSGDQPPDRGGLVGHSNRPGDREHAIECPRFVGVWVVHGVRGLRGLPPGDHFL